MESQAAMSYDSSRAPRVIVLGGTGFVGKTFAQLWPTGAPRPFYPVHRSQPDWLQTVRVVICDLAIDDPEAVLTTLRGCDVLINLLRPDGTGWYPDLMRRLKPVFSDSGIQRCIHASSIDVYAGVKDEIVDEETQPQPRSPYEEEHLAAEELLTAAFEETIVLRLGAVFGPGGRNLVNMAEEMKRAPTWKLAARRALYGDRRMHLVSVQAVTEALTRLALGRERLGSQTVLLTDDCDIRNNFAYIQSRFATAFGRAFPQNIPVLPSRLLRLALRARGLPEYGVSRRFSPAKARRMELVSPGFGEYIDAYAHELAKR